MKEFGLASWKKLLFSYLDKKKKRKKNKKEKEMILIGYFIFFLIEVTQLSLPN